MDVNQSQAQRSNTKSQIDFHGASIIDQNGRETPITEEMLENAFNALIKAWERSRQTAKK